MPAPTIENSTREERRAYVVEAWRCLHDCELCGKCRILKGRDAEILYADYIDGIRSYMEITLEIRNNTIRWRGEIIPQLRSITKAFYAILMGDDYLSIKSLISLNVGS